MRSAERSSRCYCCAHRALAQLAYPAFHKACSDLMWISQRCGPWSDAFTCAPSCGLDFRSSGVWRWSAKQVIGQLLLLKLHDSTRAKTNTLCEYLRHVRILGPSPDCFRRLLPAPRVLEPQRPRCNTLRARYGCSTHLRQASGKLLNFAVPNWSSISLF